MTADCSWNATATSSTPWMRHWVAALSLVAACSDATVAVTGTGESSEEAPAESDGTSDDDPGGSGMVLDTDGSDMGQGTSSADTTSADTSTTGPALDGTTTDDPTSTGPTPTFCEITKCDDDDPCTVDTCDPDAETCIHDLTPGTPCDDANECTSEDVCQPDGACSGTGLCTVEHCGEITEDETWGPEVIHLVTCPLDVGGPESPTLTILDGTRVEVEPGHAIVVGDVGPGRLDVQGGVEGVVFTSSEASPLPGDWWGLRFVSEDTGSTLVGAVVEYAGSLPFGAIGVYAFSGFPVDVHIVDSVVRDGAGVGVRVSGFASGAIEGTSILDNAGDGVFVDYTAHLSAPFVDNVVTGNGGAAVRLEAHEIGRLDASSTYAGNGEPIVGGGWVRESSTWQLLDAPFHISTLYVETSPLEEVTILEIEAGVTIALENSFTVGEPNEDAALQAIGTEAAPIQILGGELRFHSGSPEAPSILDHVVIEGGDGVDVLGGTVTIANSVIRETTGFRALHTWSSAVGLAVADTLIEDNAGIGVDAMGPLTAFTGNTVAGNGGVAMRVHPDVPGVMDDSTVIVGNGLDVVELWHMQIGGDTTWPALDVPYRFTEGEALRAWEPGATLTVEAGAVLEFDPGAALVVGDVLFDIEMPGGLVLAGDPGNPVVLRSAAVSPDPGDWGGVRFSPQSATSHLDHCVIQHAGAGVAAVYIQDDGIAITNCTISDSGGWGVYQDGATATLSGNTYLNNADGDVYP